MGLDYDPILKGVSVVIVEDEIALAELLSLICKVYFGAPDAQVCDSYTAAENIAKRNGNIGMFLLDIRLKDKENTGVKLAQQIRRTRDTPILLFTGGDVTSVQRKEIDALGNCAFEFKPFSVESLYRAIKHLMPGGE